MTDWTEYESRVSANESRNRETMRAMVRKHGWVEAEARAKAALDRDAMGSVSHALAVGIWNEFRKAKSVGKLVQS